MQSFGDLHLGQLICIAQRGATVTCVAGYLWVTRDGDPHDHILEPGKFYTLRGRGRVTVQALAESRFRVDVPLTLLGALLRARWSPA
jgi:hypothetical protein